MVPKLRFADFFDKWISSTLSDASVQIIDGDRGSNYPSSGDFRPMGFCLFLNAGNVTRNGFRFDDVMFITEEKDSELRKGKLQRGDIVLTTRGTLGNTAFYNNQISLENIRINSGMVLVRTKQIVTPDFLYLYFKSGYFNSWLNKVAFGSAQPQLTVKIINALSIFFPSKNEQTKIADFLSSVDEKIALLNKQYELLCQYKKGMMQKIFSQELRFKNENGKDYPKWKYSVLGNVTYLITNGLVIDQNDQGKGYPVSRIETISERKINLSKVGYVDTSKNISNYRLNYGDMLFSNINSISHIGKIAYFDINEELYHGMNLLRIVIDNNNSSLFFYHQLTAESKKKYFESRANQAVSQASINQSELKRTPIWIPCIDEQTKIANFLSAIDDKITTKKIELDKLKTWKQGLLQQMFI